MEASSVNSEYDDKDGAFDAINRKTSSRDAIGLALCDSSTPDLRLPIDSFDSCENDDGRARVLTRDICKCPKSLESPERSRKYLRSGMTPRANEISQSPLHRSRVGSNKQGLVIQRGVTRGKQINEVLGERRRGEGGKRVAKWTNAESERERFHEDGAGKARDVVSERKSSNVQHMKEEGDLGIRLSADISELRSKSSLGVPRHAARISAARSGYLKLESKRSVCRSMDDLLNFSEHQSSGDSKHNSSNISQNFDTEDLVSHDISDSFSRSVSLSDSLPFDRSGSYLRHLSPRTNSNSDILSSDAGLNYSYHDNEDEDDDLKNSVSIANSIVRPAEESGASLNSNIELSTLPQSPNPFLPNDPFSLHNQGDEDMPSLAPPSSNEIVKSDASMSSSSQLKARQQLYHAIDNSSSPVKRSAAKTSPRKKNAFNDLKSIFRSKSLVDIISNTTDTRESEVESVERIPKVSSPPPVAMDAWNDATSDSGDSPASQSARSSRSERGERRHSINISVRSASSAIVAAQRKQTSSPSKQKPTWKLQAVKAKESVVSLLNIGKGKSSGRESSGFEDSESPRKGQTESVTQHDNGSQSTDKSKSVSNIVDADLHSLSKHNVTCVENNAERVDQKRTNAFLEYIKSANKIIASRSETSASKVRSSSCGDVLDSLPKPVLSLSSPKSRLDQSISHLSGQPSHDTSADKLGNVPAGSSITNTESEYQKDNVKPQNSPKVDGILTHASYHIQSQPAAPSSDNSNLDTSSSRYFVGDLNHTPNLKVQSVNNNTHFSENSNISSDLVHSLIDVQSNVEKTGKEMTMRDENDDDSVFYSYNVTVTNEAVTSVPTPEPVFTRAKLHVRKNKRTEMKEEIVSQPSLNREISTRSEIVSNSLYEERTPHLRDSENNVINCVHDTETDSAESQAKNLSGQLSKKIGSDVNSNARDENMITANNNRNEPYFEKYNQNLVLSREKRRADISCSKPRPDVDKLCDNATCSEESGNQQVCFLNSEIRNDKSFHISDTSVVEPVAKSSLLDKEEDDVFTPRGGDTSISPELHIVQSGVQNPPTPSSVQLSTSKVDSISGSHQDLFLTTRFVPSNSNSPTGLDSEESEMWERFSNDTDNGNDGAMYCTKLKRSDSISSVSSCYSVRSTQSEIWGRRSKRLDGLLSNKLFQKHLVRHADTLEKKVLSMRRKGMMRKAVSNLDLSSPRSDCQLRSDDESPNEEVNTNNSRDVHDSGSQSTSSSETTPRAEDLNSSIESIKVASSHSLDRLSDVPLTTNFESKNYQSSDKEVVNLKESVVKSLHATQITDQPDNIQDIQEQRSPEVSIAKLHRPFKKSATTSSLNIMRNSEDTEGTEQHRNTLQNSSDYRTAGGLNQNSSGLKGRKVHIPSFHEFRRRQQERLNYINPKNKEETKLSSTRNSMYVIEENVPAINLVKEIGESKVQNSQGDSPSLFEVIAQLSTQEVERKISENNEDEITPRSRPVFSHPDITLTSKDISNLQSPASKSNHQLNRSNSEKEIGSGRRQSSRNHLSPMMRDRASTFSCRQRNRNFPGDVSSSAHNNETHDAINVQEPTVSFVVGDSNTKKLEEPSSSSSLYLNGEDDTGPLSFETAQKALPTILLSNGQANTDIASNETQLFPSNANANFSLQSQSQVCELSIAENQRDFHACEIKEREEDVHQQLGLSEDKIFHSALSEESRIHTLSELANIPLRESFGFEVEESVQEAEAVPTGFDKLIERRWSGSISQSWPRGLFTFSAESETSPTANKDTGKVKGYKNMPDSLKEENEESENMDASDSMLENEDMQIQKVTNERDDLDRLSETLEAVRSPRVQSNDKVNPIINVCPAVNDNAMIDGISVFGRQASVEGLRSSAADISEDVLVNDVTGQERKIDLTLQRTSPTNSGSDSDQSGKAAVLRSTSDVSPVLSDERERRRRDRKDRPYKSDPFTGKGSLPQRASNCGLQTSPSVTASCSFPSLEDLAEDSGSMTCLSAEDDDDIEARKKKHRLSNVSTTSEDSGVAGYTAEEVENGAYSFKQTCLHCPSYSPESRDESGRQLLHQSLSDGIICGASTCRKCELRKRERKETIQELAETEKRYGRDLTVLKEEFYRPMKATSMLTIDQLDTIFLNLEALLQAHRQFMDKLTKVLVDSVQAGDEDLTTVHIGSVFIEASAMFNSFENYCVSQGQASVLLDQLIKEKELLRVFLQVAQNENPKVRRMHLKSFLMVPVQRVMKYPLLLSRLYKVTPVYHSDKTNLKKAQQNIEDILEHINAKTIIPSGVRKRALELQSYSLSNRIEVNRVAIEAVGWPKRNVCDVVCSRLWYGQLTEQSGWSAKKTGGGAKNVKFSLVHAVLLTHGRPMDSSSGQCVLSPRELTPVQQVAMVLVKEKAGRFLLAREPLMMDRCVITVDSDLENLFEVHEQGRETYIFKGEKNKETEQWTRHLKSLSRNLGYWRRRRNGVPNIMLRAT